MRVGVFAAFGNWAALGESGQRAVPSPMRIGRVILPTGISLAIHAGIVGLAALATWTVVRPASHQMPTAELSLDGPRQTPRQPEPTPSVPDPSPAAPSIGEFAESLALPEPRPARVALPTLAPMADAASHEPIRVAGGAGTGPASFAGVTSRRASSVAFVVDCSGSMVSAMSIVLEELGRSLERLAPDQRFAIVPFTDAENSPATFPRKLALVPATDTNLREARAFLRTLAPGGRSDPLAGLRPALTLRPEAVFFLARSIPRTEGSWGDGESVIMAELDRLNPVYARKDGVSARATQINAIQFLQPDPSGIMLAIAGEHGRGASAYTVLTLEQLGRAELVGAPSARQIAADLDRASTLLASLATDATDTTVLVGFPTQQQRERTRKNAMEALSLVDHASASLGISEDGESGGDDPRVVLLGARAALLLVASDPSHEFRASLLERAARAITLLDGDALADAPTRAIALSTWALAEGLKDAPPDVATRERLARVLSAEPTLAQSSLEVTLTRAFIARGAKGDEAHALDPLSYAWSAPPFTDAQGMADPGAALLSCDAVTRASRMAGSSARADAPYASFLALDVERPTRAEREAIVRERLERLRTMPPAPGGGEPLQRLDTLLASLTPGGSPGDAADLITRVEVALAGTPHLGVEMVLERAIAILEAKDASVGDLRLAARLASIAADATAGRVPALGRAIEARTIALVRLVERAPSDATIEQLAIAVVSPDAASLAPSTRNAALLVAVSAIIGPDREPVWTDARAYDLLALVSDAVPAREAAMALAEQLDARLAALAARDGDIDRHLVSMRRSVVLSKSLGRQPRVETLDAIARALVDLGVPESVEACRVLLAHPRIGTLRDGRLGAEILLARALKISGDDAGALGVLVPLAQSMPEPGPVPPERFWMVWTMTLESMTRAEPGRTQEVRGHVTRLGLIDESLGGEPWASRLHALIGE